MHESKRTDKNCDGAALLSFAWRLTLMTTPGTKKTKDLELTPGDRRFTNHFVRSRMLVMTVVFAITLGIVIALITLLSR